MGPPRLAPRYALRLRRRGGAPGAAEAAFEALDRSPWSVLALFGLRGVAEEQGDDAEVARLTDLLCEIDICLPADP